MSIPICCVQWFCTEQPGSSSSSVPRWHTWPLPPVGCPNSKQLAMGAPTAPCVHSHTELQLSPAPSLFSLAHWLLLTAVGANGSCFCLSQ
ncbi:unnamed protein product [Staurois parvus]|uniref:Uncharacterized protein n=1 Tax=Staurois parvus TaxID=386267 RepID=A0ABN9DV89_9NEOB|nr:unnamed protein product [Staurois parvus]